MDVNTNRQLRQASALFKTTSLCLCEIVTDAIGKWHLQLEVDVDVEVVELEVQFGGERRRVLVLGVQNAHVCSDVAVHAKETSFTVDT